MDRTSEDVLIVGGGIAGLTVALDLAREGWSVRLIDKDDRLGGHAAGYACKAVEGKCQKCGACLVDRALDELNSHASVRVFLNTDIEQVEKSEKGFSVVLKGPGGSVSGVFKAVVLCHGFEPFNPREKVNLGYGRIPNIITGHELEAMLKMQGGVFRPTDGKVPERVGFVQCVGSRDARIGHPYCSQVCCGYALRMARQMRTREPGTTLTCFYMDIQTYGKDFIATWAGLGDEIELVREIPGDFFAADGDRVGVLVEIGAEIQEKVFDLLVLSVGMSPAQDQGRFQALFDLPLGAEGFLRSGALEGVFVAGSAAGPMSIVDTIAHAHASVRDIAGFLEGRR